MKKYLLIFMLPLCGIAKPGPTPVFVTPVERVPFVDEVEALGTLQSNENVELTSTVTERITKINFNDGERVRQGDVLVEMDIAQEMAELMEEQSRTDEAERQVARLQPLVDRGAASKSELDEQQREGQTAQARLNAIQSHIDERRIVAPFDGVVGLRNLSVGALAQPGTLITTLDDDRQMKLDFSVPEVFLATLKPGIQVQAYASAYPDTVFNATIASISSRVDSTTRSIGARALLDNSQGLLKAGMLMRVVLKKNPREALVVPEEAIVVQGTQKFVMLVQVQEDKTVVDKRAVQLGTRRRGEVEVLAGLAEGDQIICHGTLRVRPGAEVVIKAVASGEESLTELLGQKLN